MFRLIAISCACAALIGCGMPAPEKTIAVSNPAYTVDQLFKDANGVTVYRFLDGGDYRYYVVGPNGAQMLPSVTHETVYVDNGH